MSIQLGNAGQLSGFNQASSTQPPKTSVVSNIASQVQEATGRIHRLTAVVSMLLDQIYGPQPSPVGPISGGPSQSSSVQGSLEDLRVSLSHLEATISRFQEG